MRCLHHVFLRGGLALLLLAGAGIGAWSLTAASCRPTQAANEATALRGPC